MPSNDFSLFSLFTAGLAFFAPLVVAQGPGFAPSYDHNGSWGTSTATTWSHPSNGTGAWGTGAAAPTGWAGHNGTHHTWAKTTAKPTSDASPSSAYTPPSAPSGPATSTGGAAAMATSFAGLVVAGGVAVLAI